MKYSNDPIVVLRKSGSKYAIVSGTLGKDSAFSGFLLGVTNIASEYGAYLSAKKNESSQFRANIYGYEIPDPFEPVVVLRKSGTVFGYIDGSSIGTVDSYKLAAIYGCQILVDYKNAIIEGAVAGTEISFTFAIMNGYQSTSDYNDAVIEGRTYQTLTDFNYAVVDGRARVPLSMYCSAFICGAYIPTPTSGKPVGVLDDRGPLPVGCVNK